MRGQKPIATPPDTATLPDKPSGLDSDASAMWDLVTKHRTAWIDEADGPALLSLCECWSLRCRANAALKADATNKDARIAYVQYQQSFERMLSRFGLSPVDRERLGDKVTEDDWLAREYLR